MSITVSNCQQIARSPLNNSKSKMLFTFSKSERFKNIQKVLCDKFYEIDNSRDTRTAGFGYGRKYDFTRGANCSPSPNTYNIRTLFEDSKIHKKGFGFGEGREEMEATGIMSASKNNKNPGPGTYEVPSTLSKISYSMKDRVRLDGDQPNKVPGPGNYPVSFELNKTGRYFLSKYKNSGAKVFNPKHSGRFKEAKHEVPGPGQYDVSKTSFSAEGRYFLSKLCNSKSRTFPHEVRKTLSNFSATPGPGNYKLPSEFGHYVSKHTPRSFSPKTDENKQNVPKQSKQAVKVKNEA